MHCADGMACFCSNDQNERLGGVLAIDELIDVKVGHAATLLPNYGRKCMTHSTAHVAIACVSHVAIAAMCWTWSPSGMTQCSCQGDSSRLLMQANSQDS